MKKLMIFCAVSILIIHSCSSTQEKKPSTTQTTTEAPVEVWTYAADTDKMTSAVVYKCYVESKSELKMKFPYEGALAYLTIRNKDGANDIYYHVTKGQILAGNPVDGGSIRVRFDNDKPETYAVTGTSDGSSEAVFIINVKTFLLRIKKSKKMIIEAEFFDNGMQQSEFDTDGLKWSH